MSLRKTKRFERKLREEGNMHTKKRGIMDIAYKAILL